jgi:hypothetical protein
VTAARGVSAATTGIAVPTNHGRIASIVVATRSTGSIMVGMAGITGSTVSVLVITRDLPITILAARGVAMAIARSRHRAWAGRGTA